jgi:hypothetical protein
MGMFWYIYGFIKRTLLYQIFIVFSFLRLITLEKSAKEFRDKINQITQSCHYLKELTEKVLTDPIFAFKVFIGLQVGSAIVAILRIPILGRLAGFLCAILMTANIIIYELTLPAEGKPVIWKNWQTMLTMESVISVVVVLGILANVFSSHRYVLK